MRAIYIEDYQFCQETVLSGPHAHHLINVLRLKIGADLLILDGHGQVTTACIVQINKGQVFCQAVKSKRAERQMVVDLAVGLVKKDALELIIKQACELGIRKIYILETVYSQRYQLNLIRLKKLLISASEQSNNPFLPELIIARADDLPLSDYDSVNLFSLGKPNSPKKLNLAGKHLVLIGPEGGFSSEEESLFEQSDKTQKIQLKTYILRSSTIVATAVGFLFGRFDQ